MVTPDFSAICFHKLVKALMFRCLRSNHITIFSSKVVSGKFKTQFCKCLEPDLQRNPTRLSYRLSILHTVPLSINLCGAWITEDVNQDILLTWAPIRIGIYNTCIHTKREEKFLWEYSDVDQFIFKIWISKMKINEKGEELGFTEKDDDIFKSYSIV